MSDEKIPSYPVVHVTMQADGSAHVNIAGKHVDYPAADGEVTRAQIITHVIDLAARLARGVRMTTVDPDGEWKLGIYPDGEVVDLDPTPAKGRGAAKKPAAAPRPPLCVIDPMEQALAAPVAAAPRVTTRAKADIDESHTVVHTRLSDATSVQDTTIPRAIAPKPARDREPGTLVATMAFSSGDTVVVGPHAIIGRMPAATATDPAGSQLVVIHDKERKVSRVHCEVGWVGSKLVVTDRASGNGTYITRRGTRKIELEPGKPYELQGDDWLGVGTDITCRVIIAVIAVGGTR